MADPTTLSVTRDALHAVAELVLAGAQHTACGRITLAVRADGFGTRFDPDLRVEGTDLVGAFGRTTLDGATARSLCAAAGVGLADLSGVYADGAALGPDDVLRVDAGAVEELTRAWWLGHQALSEVSDVEPILWPEHFDVGVSVGEVNLGVSPGDAYLGVPYAYVGPWTVPQGDAFFDAPFGAARPVSQLDGIEGLVAFFTEGLDRVGGPAQKKSENM